MKTRSVASAVLLAFLSSTISLPALAEDDPATTQARARFKEGVDYYDKGQFENARLAFQQAYMLKKHPAVLLNLAQSGAKANHPLEASRYFQQFLREATSATPQQRKDAEKGLAEVRSKLGMIDVLGPPGVEITLDDKERLGTTPIAEPVDVEPGPHTFKSPAEQLHVTIAAGQRMQVKFGDRPAPVVAAPAPALGPAADAATPEPASAPTDPSLVPESSHKKPGLFSPPKHMAPVWAGVAVGGVGLVGTILFAVFKADAQSKADQVAADISAAAQASTPPVPVRGLCNDTTQPRFTEACNTLRDNNSKVDTNATIANVSAVVMVGGLLFAGGWYLFAPKRDAHPAEAPPPVAKPTVHVLPYGGYGQGGLNLTGTF